MAGPDIDGPDRSVGPGRNGNTIQLPKWIQVEIKSDGGPFSKHVRGRRRAVKGTAPEKGCWRPAVSLPRNDTSSAGQARAGSRLKPVLRAQAHRAALAAQRT
jgi:hypothetical protein